MKKQNVNLMESTELFLPQDLLADANSLFNSSGMHILISSSNMIA